MEKKELLEKLIAHYEESIELVKGETDFYNAKSILELKKVDNGICYCATKIFNISLYSQDWLDKYIKIARYWAERPYDATSIPEVISLLKVRVDIMRKELENE